MANFVYNDFKHDLGIAAVDFTADDFRVLFVMTNTTVDFGTDNTGTDAQDVATIGAFDDIDEYGGAGHPAGGIALTGETFTKNVAASRSEFDATDVVFSALGAGLRQAQAALLYKFVTSLALSQPVAYYDTGGFPFAGSGSDVTIQWNTGGVLQIT